MMANTSGGKDIATVIKANMNAAAHAQALESASASAAQAAEKAKHKPAFHYSSAMTRYYINVKIFCMLTFGHLKHPKG